MRTDFTRPFNNGDLLHFVDDPVEGARSGQFPLYDEFDPQRIITLEDNGTKSVNAAAKQFFLNFIATEGPLDTRGTPAVATDGDDVIFGDVGNDWLVGGTGRDTLWGGWGNDLLNADDVLTTDGRPQQRAPTRTQPTRTAPTAAPGSTC